MRSLLYDYQFSKDDIRQICGQGGQPPTKPTETQTDTQKIHAQNEQQLQQLTAASGFLESAIPVIREIIRSGTIPHILKIEKFQDKAYAEFFKIIITGESIEDIIDKQVYTIRNNPYIVVTLSKYFTVEEMNIFLIS